MSHFQVFGVPPVDFAKALKRRVNSKRIPVSKKFNVRREAESFIAEHTPKGFMLQKIEVVA